MYCLFVQSEGDYKNYRLPKLYAGTLEMKEAVLRTGKLEETLTEGETLHPSVEGKRLICHVCL